MESTLGKVRSLLEANRPDLAHSQLREWVVGGDPHLLKELDALTIDQLPPAKQGEVLARFVAKLFSQSADMVRFLDHANLGLAAYQQQSWAEAVEHYRAALAAHLPTYQTRRDLLESRLAAGKAALDMQGRIQAGNQAYLKRRWEEAGTAFKEARRLLRPEFGINRSDFDEVIDRCQQGVTYDSWVTRGQASQAQGELVQALRAFEEALRLYHQDFYPEASVIKQEIELCQEALSHRVPVVASFSLGGLWQLIRRGWIPAAFIALLILFLSLYLNWRKSDETPLGPPITLDTTSVTPAPQPVLVEDTVVPQDNLFVESLPEEAEMDDPPSVPMGVKPQIAEPLALSALEDIPESEEQGPAPLADVELIVSGDALAGEPLTFRVMPYEPGVSYEIDFGNGSRLNMKQQQSFTYSQPGTYRVQVWAEANGRGIRTHTRTLRIQETSSNPVATMEEPVLKPARDTVVPAASREQLAAATPPAPAPAPAAPLPMAEQMPAFPGGESAMIRFLQDRIRYPDLAREQEVTGTVYVRFTVEADGSLSSFRLLRGIGAGCDEEALRVARLMPRWKAGRQDGRTVPVLYTIPVAFRLP